MAQQTNMSSANSSYVTVKATEAVKKMNFHSNQVLNDIERNSMSLEESQKIDSILSDYRDSRGAMRMLATKLETILVANGDERREPDIKLCETMEDDTEQLSLPDLLQLVKPDEIHLHKKIEALARCLNETRKNIE